MKIKIQLFRFCLVACLLSLWMTPNQNTPEFQQASCFFAPTLPHFAYCYLPEITNKLGNLKFDRIVFC